MTPIRQATGSRLAARTVALDAEVDLADIAGDHGILWEAGDGSGMAGWGAAARIAVPLGAGTAAEDVVAGLGAIHCDGPRPPVALGALPFSSSERGELVVPAVLVRREADGSCWLTVTESDPALSAVDEVRRRVVASRRQPENDAPRDYRVRSSMEQGAWRQMVAGAAEAVVAGRFAKVVLAREVTVEADRPLRPSEVARRLRLSHPSCMVFSVDGFVGASPELLVERHGDRVRSQPLAGTVARTGSPGHQDELVAWLLSSDKERQEHRLVVDAVAGALRSYCDELSVPEVPALVPVGTLAHLGTLISGRLAERSTTVLELVDAIHPSPAVGGTPTGAALAYIAAVEGLDRGRYAGPVGWVDAEGDGCFAVGIRSAQIEGNRARLMAGVGVVAGSDPDAELAETELKLQPMLGALIRP